MSLMLNCSWRRGGWILMHTFTQCNDVFTSRSWTIVWFTTFNLNSFLKTIDNPTNSRLCWTNAKFQKFIFYISIVFLIDLHKKLPCCVVSEFMTIYGTLLTGDMCILRDSFTWYLTNLSDLVSDVAILTEIKCRKVDSIFFNISPSWRKPEVYNTFTNLITIIKLQNFSYLIAFQSIYFWEPTTFPYQFRTKCI